MESTDPISMTYGQTSDLVNRIEQIPPLTGTGAPTTSTPAWYIGQRYIDTQSNNEYYCVEIPSSGVVGYVWQPVDTSTSYTGGDGINIDAQNVISATNTGKARVLTSEDYNYPANNPNGVALWLLEPGIYTSAYGTQVHSSSSDFMSRGGLFIISASRATDGYKVAYLAETSNISGDYIARARLFASDGRVIQDKILLGQNDITNNLTSTSTIKPLSAAQGKVLNDKIGGDLSSLTTTDKTSLIAAINELNANLNTANTDLQTLLNGTGA